MKISEIRKLLNEGVSRDEVVRRMGLTVMQTEALLPNHRIPTLQKVTWYIGDITVIQDALEMYKSNLEEEVRERTEDTEEEREEKSSYQQAVVVCIDLLQHIDWLFEGTIVHDIKVDMGPNSYEPPLK